MSVVALAGYLAAEVLPFLAAESRYNLSHGSLGTIYSLTACVLLAAVTPRQWKPPLPSDQPSRWQEAKSTDEETCSWLDYYLTFGRLTPLIWKGFQENIAIADLPDLPWYDSADCLLAKIKEGRSKEGKTLWTIVNFARADIAAAALYAAILRATQLVSPYSFYKLLDYLLYPESAKIHPYTWVVLMFASSMVQLAALQQHNMTLGRLNMRIKVALTAEIYQRTLASRELEGDFLGSASDSGGPRPTASSQLANLVSNDITMVTFASHVIMVAVGVPITVTCALIGLYKIVSWTSLVGLVIIIICFPLPTWIVRNVEGAQDSRISLASEYLGAMRVIKYFAWEDIMTSSIAQVRAEEQQHLWRIDVLYALMREATELIPALALLAIFSLYIGVLKQPLTAPVAFTTVMLVKMIKSHLYLLGVISPRLTRASLSLKRIDKFFQATTPLQSHPDGPLKVEEATFQRNSDTHFQLKDVSINFCESGLNIVTGPSGSGKTTLLLALLGEALFLDGRVSRPKTIAYAPQSPWLQAQSVRANILLNRPYDATRYRNIIHACCLSVDLNEMPHGDETDVGEDGTSLSGGQRARVALARTLYSDAPVLLLDDVFSALDSKTAHTLWDRVFGTNLLQGRTIVLVSQLPWMLSQADLTITLANGTVRSVDQNLGLADVATAPHEHQPNSEGHEIKNDTNDGKGSDSTPKVDDSHFTAIDEEVRSGGGKSRLTGKSINRDIARAENHANTY